MSDYLLWMDLETTGLNPERCAVLEVAAYLTNHHLSIVDASHMVIECHPEVLERMAPFIREMHTSNGLLAEVAYSTTTLEVEENYLLDILDRHGIDKATLAGSGVAAFDIAVIRAQMPRLASRLNYWTVDVGVLRRTWRMWTGSDLTDVNAAKTHRARDDIDCHLAEARAFRAVLSAAARGAE